MIVGITLDEAGDFTYEFAELSSLDSLRLKLKRLRAQTNELIEAYYRSQNNSGHEKPWLSG